MKKPVKKRRPRRVVLGVGHPWFSGYDIISLLPGDSHGETIPLKFKDLGSYNKIRLVAEVLK